MVPKYIGARYRRIEDLRLVTGSAEYADNLPVPSNAYYVKILRSPYAHARIRRIDASKALKLPGVRAVLTGKDIVDLLDPFPMPVPIPVKFYPIAVEKTRYVGEPVAVVVAKDVPTAEDALQLIEADYQPLKPVLTIADALKGESLVHEELGSNIAWHRTYKFGDPDSSLAKADLVVETKFKVPRFTLPALETYVVMAEYKKSTDELTIYANEQGPLVQFYLMARALRKPFNKIRLITPRDIGGGFGEKVPVLFEATLIGAAAEALGVPLKYVKTRTEHAMTSSAAAERLAEVKLALRRDGKILGLRYKFFDNYGAYIRSPEPGVFFRHYANLTGPYKIKDLEADVTGLFTNTLPSNPVRGFGGQHLYFPLEKAVAKAVKALGLSQTELRLKNFIQPNEMPYRTPTGGLYDSGDYPGALAKLLGLMEREKIYEYVKRAREEGRLVGIGIATTVDPSGSTMGYLDTIFTPEFRKSKEYLPKSGSFEFAKVKISPLGEVLVTLPTNPIGQGNETAVAQVVADVLGISPEEVTVLNNVDTYRDAWSLLTGSYSSRFAAVAINAAYNAAVRLRERLLKIASKLLGAPPDRLELRDGKVFDKADPSRSMSFRRLVGTAYWNTHMLQELGEEPELVAVATYQAPTLAPVDLEDRVNSSATYAFTANAAVVEVDPETGFVKLLKFLSVDDAGRIINLGVFEQQIIGQVNQALAFTLYQGFIFDEEGRPVNTDFDTWYMLTADQAPDDIRWESMESPSPFSPIGSKGFGEALFTSAPIAILLAVEDALGVEFEEVPVTPEKVWRTLRYVAS